MPLVILGTEGGCQREPRRMPCFTSEATVGILAPRALSNGTSRKNIAFTERVGRFQTCTFEGPRNLASPPPLPDCRRRLQKSSTGYPVLDFRLPSFGPNLAKDTAGYPAVAWASPPWFRGSRRRFRNSSTGYPVLDFRLPLRSQSCGGNSRTKGRGGGGTAAPPYHRRFLFVVAFLKII